MPNAATAVIYNPRYGASAAHQLPAPAGPQYDDTVTFTLKQPQRKWVAVDEVIR